MPIQEMATLYIMPLPYAELSIFAEFTVDNYLSYFIIFSRQIYIFHRCPRYYLQNIHPQSSLLTKKSLPQSLHKYGFSPIYIVIVPLSKVWGSQIWPNYFQMGLLHTCNLMNIQIFLQLLGVCYNSNYFLWLLV